MNTVNLSFLCKDDIDKRDLNHVHSQILKHVRKDLIDWFTKKGVRKEDVEDLFSAEYYSVKSWICKQEKPIDSAFLFRVFRKIMLRHLAKPGSPKFTELTTELIDVSAADIKVIDENLRSILLYQCIEKLPPYLRVVIKNYLEYESTPVAVRAASLRISVNDYYVRASHARKKIKNCLKNNPLWFQQFND